LGVCLDIRKLSKARALDKGRGDRALLNPAACKAARTQEEEDEEEEDEEE
jgi:hypothetical protein